MENLNVKRKREPKHATSDVRFAFTIAKLEAELLIKREERKQLEEGENTRQLDKAVAETESRLKAIDKLLKIVPPADANEMQMCLASGSLGELTFLQRWKMYSAWKSLVVDILDKRAAEIEAECRSVAKELKDVETLETAEIIRGAAVVGITTTGAAKQKALLEHLKCKIGKHLSSTEPFSFHFILPFCLFLFLLQWWSKRQQKYWKRTSSPLCHPLVST